MIEIDGSRGEGGGAILRTALSLSTISGLPFRMSRVRASRPQPGLKAQHLAAVTAFRALFASKAHGADPGSTTLEFFPGPPARSRLDLDVGTAGSVTLLLQSLLPALLHARRRFHLTLKGGTDVAWSPTWDYFALAHAPFLLRYGAVECKLARRGYYPAGGGEVHVLVSGERGLGAAFLLAAPVKAMAVEGVAHAHADLEPGRVASRMAAGAAAALADLHVPLHISAQFARTPSVGCGLALVARCSPARDLAPTPPSIDHSSTMTTCALGADALGRRGISAEEVGEACGRRLAQLVAAGFPVDPHHADMLIPYMALAPGSEIATLDLTEHLRSNIYVAERFLPVRYTIDGHTVTSEKRS